MEIVVFVDGVLVVGVVFAGGVFVEIVVFVDGVVLVNCLCFC